MIVESAINIYLTPGPKASMNLKLVVANHKGEETELHTLNRAQVRTPRKNLEASVAALKFALLHAEETSIPRIVLHTAAEYLLANYKKALFEWPAAGWKDRRSGKPVANADIWKDFLRLNKKAALAKVRVDCVRLQT